MLVALLLLGGDMLQNFSIALIIGVIVGTFSSLYVASALLIALSHLAGRKLVNLVRS